MESTHLRLLVENIQPHFVEQKLSDFLNATQILFHVDILKECIYRL